MNLSRRTMPRASALLCVQSLSANAAMWIDIQSSIVDMRVPTDFVNCEQLT